MSGAPDVELILHAYLAWGEGCVEHLLGDFVFAVWDVRTRRLFCARDHMGVKPLYWWSDGTMLLFASEMKSLLQHPALAERRVNRAGVAQVLVDIDDELLGQTAV